MNTERKKHKSGLSPARRALLDEMQDIQFGVIRNLPVKAGEPVLSPSVRVLRELKLGGRGDEEKPRSLKDYVLKKQVVELLAYLDELRDGVIQKIEVQSGLPFKISVAEAAKRATCR